MNTMDIYEILKRIPHRYPIILVDKVVDMKPGDYLVAIKNVSMNEPYFCGHFPEMPVMPGVLILEALAQACVLLSTITEGASRENCLHFFAGIDNARFKQIVKPGDSLKLHVKLKRQKRDVWKIYGEASVEDKVVCSADLMSIQKDITP